MSLSTPSFKQSGLTMVEALVTIVVISFSLLAMAGLQLNSLGGSKEASLRTTATVLGYDILDAMRANRTAALAGSYNIALSAAAPTGASIAEEDLKRLLTQSAARLPSGDSSVSVDANRMVTVVIQWDDSRGAASARQFRIVSML